MSSLSIDLKDRRPIYEQLIDQIMDLVLHGVMQPGEQLPSVRALAGELAINPNTIQKAYAELERQGILSRTELYTEYQVYETEKYGKETPISFDPNSAPTVEEIISGAVSGSSVGIIGGADGPTSIVITKD